MPGKLTLCATPIGNLADAPPRLAELLAGCELIYAEDTRRTAVLLGSLGISRPIRSYFAGNEHARSEELTERLRGGATVGLVTDAGTPAISDPGLTAVAAARAAGATVSVIPGPSAVTAALAVSGFPANRFVFEGFLPRKGRERRTRLEMLAGEPRTMVLFISPHRLGADLSDLGAALGPDHPICVCRELTKLYEEVVWTTLSAAAEMWSEPRGEFTIVLAGVAAMGPDVEEAVVRARVLVGQGHTRSAAARQVSAETGADRRQLYSRLIEP